MFFKCKHPADKLGVIKDESRLSTNFGWELVTYHLLCYACKKNVDVKYVRVTSHENAHEQIVYWHGLGD